MKFLSPQTEAMASITLAKAALYNLSQLYYESSYWSGESLRSAENHLDNALAALRGRHPVPGTNPCAEILMRSTRPDND